jgi:hypothetical protein
MLLQPQINRLGEMLCDNANQVRPGNRALINLNALATITKAGRAAIDEALRDLDAIPMLDDDHISVPWQRIVKRPKLDPEVWVDSEVTAVTIADLCATQTLLTKKRVEFFIMNPGAIETGRRAFANVYATGNRNVIIDGHHRLSAFWLLGAEVANVWFLED